jgi:6-phosphofructokinase 1
MSKLIGLLTAGGDTPGLNAALRGIGKAAIETYGMQVIGFRDGFRGLTENRMERLEREKFSGILTLGGTVLGTSRDKPHRMLVGGKYLDMTDVIVENYHKNQLEALVCIGGGGTQKNALKLKSKGLNILTLPKTIDNDIEYTDTTFGFDTALGIATEAIDRLHSTAHSHHRIIVVEIMGHRVGWLALGAGLSGGADVILLPEIPYSTEIVAESILKRTREGKRFSIIAVAEGAVSKDEVKKNGKRAEEKKDNVGELPKLESRYVANTMNLAKKLEELTLLESRVTILGYLQRGGTPSAFDRVLATRLGTACAGLINKGTFGVMVAAKGERTEPVPLEQVAGNVKYIPLDHPWLESARRIGVNLGD